MRAPLLLTFLPLAFAGPSAQNRWGFGLLDSLFAGSSDTTTTATTATTETTTKSGMFGFGLLPNSGGLLGFGLLGGSSESSGDTSTGQLCSRASGKQGDCAEAAVTSGKPKNPKKCSAHKDCKDQLVNKYCPVHQSGKKRVCTECMSNQAYEDGEENGRDLCNTREKPRCVDNKCSPNCGSDGDCYWISGYTKCFVKGQNPGTCESCSPKDNGKEGGNGCAEDKPYCTEVKSGSDPVSCVECLESTDCKKENKPICNEATHACQGCNNDNSLCKKLDENFPICYNEKCVQCVQDGDCGSGKKCNTLINMCQKACGSDADCKNADKFNIPTSFHKCDDDEKQCRYQALFKCQTTWYVNKAGTFNGKEGPEIILEVYDPTTSQKHSECHFHVNVENDGKKKTVTSNCPYKKGNTVDSQSGGEAIIKKMEDECYEENNQSGEKFGSEMKVGATKATFVKEKTAKFSVDLTADLFKFVKK